MGDVAPGLKDFAFMAGGGGGAHIKWLGCSSEIWKRTMRYQDPVLLSRLEFFFIPKRYCF